MTTVQNQIHWQDVKEGDTIPGYTLDLTWTKMVGFKISAFKCVA
ncbi:MAG: hypothetical protein P8J64_07345 [Dehalococcoidia bacterium]|nr:hypothetical protein [Dehalococcoidia bacterium]